MSKHQSISIECGTDYLSDENLHAEIQTEGATADECVKNAAIFWVNKDGDSRRDTLLKDHGGKFYDLCERIIRKEFDAKAMRAWEQEQEGARR
jgi:hypothetical protein